MIDNKYTKNENKYTKNENKYTKNENKYTKNENKCIKNENKYTKNENKYTKNENKYTKLEQNTLIQTYSRLPIVIKSAIGNRIIDINDIEYRDYLAGIAVNILGHSNPAIVTAIKEQIEKYLHISNYFYQPIQIDFANKLKEISGFERIFFANSGAEANEAAIKLARLWGNLNNKRKIINNKRKIINNKRKIIAFSGGFHGRTLGTLSLMDKPKYKTGMGPFVPDINIIEFNNSEELIRNIDGVTAIFMEFIQGEGGIVPVTDAFIDTINKLREKNDFILIADEVQAGLGRTGRMFSYENWGIVPDIITLAKGLGGGLPISAMLVNSKVGNIFQKGQHGTTFGGNPVACAAGIAVLRELNNGIIENSAIIGQYFIDELNKIKVKLGNSSVRIIEIRGKGLMIGVEMNISAQILVNKLLERRIIANQTSENVLRLLPPLNITREDVDYFIKEFIVTIDSIL